MALDRAFAKVFLCVDVDEEADKGEAPEGSLPLPSDWLDDELLCVHLTPTRTLTVERVLDEVEHTTHACGCTHCAALPSPWAGKRKLTPPTLSVVSLLLSLLLK